MDRAADPHRLLVAETGERGAGLPALPLFLPMGCCLFLPSFSLRVAAVVKVMHWVSRKSSSFPEAMRMPCCFSSACSSASSRG